MWSTAKKTPFQMFSKYLSVPPPIYLDNTIDAGGIKIPSFLYTCETSFNLQENMCTSIIYVFNIGMHCRVAL